MAGTPSQPGTHQNPGAYRRRAFQVRVGGHSHSERNDRPDCEDCSGHDPSVIRRSERAGNQDEPSRKGSAGAEDEAFDERKPGRDTQPRNELIGRAQTFDPVVKGDADGNRQRPRDLCGDWHEEPAEPVDGLGHGWHWIDSIFHPSDELATFPI